MDFALPELGNLLAGSVINAGADRMMNAGASGTPQIIAPGCLDLIDFAGWQQIPEQYSDRPFHEHNRLIKSSGLNAKERRETAREMAKRIKSSNTRAHVILTTKGIEEWDRPGEPAYDPKGLSEFCDEMRKVMTRPIEFTELNCHINDEEFVDKTLEIFDSWIADGTIKI